MSQIAFHGSTNTIKIAASTASTNMALSVTGAQPQVQIGNATTGWANVVFGSSNVTSTMPTTSAGAPGYMVAPGDSVIVTPGLATYIGVSLNTGTGAIYATAGSES